MSDSRIMAQRNQIEFIVSDFFRYVWTKRLLLLVVTFLFGCLALSISFFRAVIPTPITFYVELQSIKNGEYPDSSKVSPGDLIVPEVVDAVRARFSNAFTQQDFVKGVVVEYGSPLVRPLLNRYEILLSNCPAPFLCTSDLWIH